MGLRQFRHHILSLQEQANGVRAHQRLGVGEQQGQGRQRPGRHEVEGLGGQGLYPFVLDPNPQAHPLGGGGQEGAFLPGGFMQGHGDLWPHRREHQPGEPGPGTQIGQSPGSRRDQGPQLGGIKEMAAPKVGKGTFGHQIVALVPIGQQIGICLQPGKCFT